MDIVERLRSYTENDAYSEPWTLGKTVNEAADEIERLREALLKVAEASSVCVSQIEDITRAALKETE